MIFQHAPAAGAQEAPREVVDEIVASVNSEPILWTDVLWQVALSPAGNPQQIDAGTKQRVLEAIIDTKLLQQEAEKLPSISVSDSEIQKALAKLVAAFPSEELFRARAQSAGLTPGLIRDLLKHRIEVEKYTDFRFRTFVVVRDEEVSEYYEKILLPRMKARGEIQSLAETRAGILELLTEEKVSQEMEKWLADARERSDITITGARTEHTMPATSARPRANSYR